MLVKNVRPVRKKLNREAKDIPPTTKASFACYPNALFVLLNDFDFLEV